MDPVKQQYEAYPYPPRDPAEEKQRLVTGSPSHPLEIDHYLFGGQRDWKQPFRVLVAGGGTGDSLIMLAQLLKDRGTPATVVYLDMSAASRRIAEARAAARGLEIRFLTGDLLTAPEHGPFDYIDCCGVLHHLPDPDAGFAALAAALAPEGGMGGMLYAPHGRSGVYALQEALRPLIDGLSPEAQVAKARAALKRLPESHPFARNPLVGDHEQGDAGLYDLLLHSRDRAYEADEVIEAVARAGMVFAGFVPPARYRPETYLGAELAEPMKDAPFAERAVAAERFCGTLRKHVFYAGAPGRTDLSAEGRAAPGPEAIPVLHGLERQPLAKTIANAGRLRVAMEGLAAEIRLDRSLAPLAARIDGKASLEMLRQASGMDWIRFQTVFQRLAEPLSGLNLLLYSRFKR